MSEGQDDGRPRIQNIPFDGTDYPTWKFRMNALFCATCLIDMVEGTSTLTGSQLKGTGERIWDDRLVVETRDY